MKDEDEGQEMKYGFAYFLRQYLVNRAGICLHVPKHNDLSKLALYHYQYGLRFSS